MPRIAIVGPESTGKSSLALELGIRMQGTVVPEYAREFLAGKATYTQSDLSIIAREQFKRMCAAEGEVVFFDTDLTVIKIWSEQKFGALSSEINELWTRQQVDAYLLTYPDLPWEPDPQRESKGQLKYLFEKYASTLTRDNAMYHVVRGMGSARVANAMNAVRFFLANNRFS